MLFKLDLAFVSTGRDSDKPERINISILSGYCRLWTLRDHKTFWIIRLRHRLHGRGFQSKRFHDLETASKTIRFQRVYTEPIQPLSTALYVKAISFSGLCASSIGSKFDQTPVRRLSFPRPNPESSFSFSLRYSAGAYRRKSQHFKTSLPVVAVWLSVYSKIHESCKSEVKPP